ncbi:MAG: SDR family oxidoreductase, partial [Alphaproteobacteria bacterium]
MRVLVVGAYGLIGSHVLAALRGAGHEVVAIGRTVEAAARAFPYARWIAADLARLRAPGDWTAHLAGIDAVVNCAGVLQDGPRDDLRAVQVDAAVAIFHACAATGVRRIVQVSAAGVGPAAGTAFFATKHEAEAALAGLDLDWVVLRPGLVFAPTAYGGTALLRGLAAFPWIVPAAYADRVVQTVAVDDVAAAAVRAVDPAAPARVTVDIVAAERTRLGDLLVALRAWLGLPPAHLVSLPPALARVPAAAGDLAAWFGWRSPLRSTAMAQLRAGVEGEAGACEAMLGVRPKSFAQTLEAWPAGVQERWFAKLYFLKPLLLVVLAAFWLASGVVGLVRWDAAAGVLTQAGWSGSAAVAAVAGGAAIDIALAAMVCFRRTAPMALQGMIAVSAAYLLGGTIVRPDLWLDPLGPFVKVVPAAVLALAVARRGEGRGRAEAARTGAARLAVSAG